MSFKYRDHRGGLAESMETVQKLESKDDLVNYLQSKVNEYDPAVDCSKIIIKPYGYDSRINWDTHIVTLDGYGVFGFTDKGVV